MHNKLIYIFLILFTADMVLTHIGLNSGVPDANPLYSTENNSTNILNNLILHIIIGIGAYFFHKYNKDELQSYMAYPYIMYGICIFYSIVLINNIIATFII